MLVFCLPSLILKFLLKSWLRINLLLWLRLLLLLLLALWATQCRKLALLGSQLIHSCSQFSAFSYSNLSNAPCWYLIIYSAALWNNISMPYHIPSIIPRTGNISYYKGKANLTTQHLSILLAWHLYYSQERIFKWVSFICLWIWRTTQMASMKVRKIKWKIKQNSGWKTK